MQYKELKNGDTIFATGVYLTRDSNVNGGWVVEEFHDESYYMGEVVEEKFSEQSGMTYYIGTDFETAKEGMITNGFSYFNVVQFGLKSKNPCYIPENAEGVEDIYSYQRMLDETLEALQNYNILSGESTEEFATNIVENFFSDLSEIWESFSTYLEQYLDNSDDIDYKNTSETLTEDKEHIV